jgi:hypothetical protein
MTGAEQPLDPNQVLRELRPPARSGYMWPGENPHADELLRQITVRQDRLSRRRRRARIVVVVAATSVVIGGTAAAAVVIVRRADDPTRLACYSGSDVETAIQFAIEPESGKTPLEQCAELWSDGRLGSAGAPSLVGCVTDADIVAVLPGDAAACAAAGWDLADAATPVEVDPAALLTSELSDRFAGECINVDAASEEVHGVLARLELSDWTVVDHTTGESCTVPVINVESRAIELISRPQQRPRRRRPRKPPRRPDTPLRSREHVADHSSHNITQSPCGVGRDETCVRDITGSPGVRPRSGGSPSSRRVALRRG